MNCFVEKKKMKSASGHPVEATPPPYSCQYFSASGHPVEATPQVVLYACCWVIGLCMSGE